MTITNPESALKKEISELRSRATATDKQLRDLNKLAKANPKPKRAAKEQLRDMTVTAIKNKAWLDVKNEITIAAQMCCNPQDSLHHTNRQPLLLPVNGNVPTTAYTDVDNIPVSYPGASSESGLPSSQAVGIMYSDYVRNNVLFVDNKAGLGSTNVAYKSKYVGYGVNATANVKTSIPSQVFSRLVTDLASPMRFAYFAPTQTELFQPHGPIMGVGFSDRDNNTFFYMNKGDYMNLTYYNDQGAVVPINVALYRYGPEGAEPIYTFPMNPAAGAQVGTYYQVNFDGYYALTLKLAPNATQGGIQRFAFDITNYNVAGTVTSDHCWAHLPAPGFSIASSQIEAARVNGTTLEYHNVGSVTNGLVYAGQFEGIDWIDLVGGGFASFQQQTRDNEIKQNTDEVLGALVRIPLGTNRGDDLVSQHKHQLGIGVTYLSFPLDNPGPFCVLWSNILLGNLGSPQSATWKRGIYLQFETFDTTRFVGVGDMSWSQYQAVKGVISKVPYWGSNDFHWQEVGKFIKQALDVAERAAPFVGHLVSLF